MLVDVLITLLILVIAFAVIYWFVGFIAVPQPFRKIILGLIAAIIIVYILGIAFDFSGFHPIRMR